MAKIREEKVREDFRGKLNISEVARVKQDPNYVYKLVIHTYDHDPARVDRYIEAGWDVVSSEQSVEDKRSHVPDNSDESSLRQKPVLKRLRGSGGHTAVLMRIKKDLYAANQLKKAERDAERQRRATTKNRVSKDGNSIKITEPEIDFSKNEQIGDDL